MKTTKTLLATAACALAILTPLAAHAAGVVVLNENFNNIGTLSNWVQVNNSLPPGQGWFQGNSGVFRSYAGAPDSYIAANYLSAGQDSGTIDSWLITPELSLGGMTNLSFFTRTQTIPGMNDMLEVRFSAGAGTATSGFTTLLTTVGGPNAYPGSWQEITASLTLPASGRFAFRYLGNAATANYIGIDSFRVSAVPEPSAYLMFGLGIALLPLLRRKTGA
jgi:hypothetical protein